MEVWVRQRERAKELARREFEGAKFLERVQREQQEKGIE